MTSSGGAEGGEKNNNSINYERQQARSSTTDRNMLTSSILMPATVLRSIPEAHHTAGHVTLQLVYGGFPAFLSIQEVYNPDTTCSVYSETLDGGAIPSGTVSLQLTEEDLEVKLGSKEVDKNLKRTSDENLTEHFQKAFGSEPQPDNLLLNHSSEVSITSADQGEERGVDAPPTSIHPLHKQLNLLQRPTSLQLLSKTEETGFVSSRLRLGKLKLKHRQVETGVAKMNTVMVAVAAEPHLVTTVTNNVAMNGREAPPTSSYSTGVPTLVRNVIMGGGRTNPAGPQEEEEGGRTDKCLNLLSFSPDEHEPLLRREHLPAESAPPPLHQLHHLHHHSQAGNVSNNNNNQLALGSGVGSEACFSGRVCSPEPEPDPVPHLEHKILLAVSAPPDENQGSAPGQEVTKDVQSLGFIQNPGNLPVHSTVTAEICRVEVTGTQTSQELDLDASGSDTRILTQKPSSTEAPAAPEGQLSDSKSSLEVSESTELEPAGLLQSQERRMKTRRPERPCSLDLSPSCISSNVSLIDGDSLSATGEKIKRRVKTPYMLKKWRPASWVVSTDTALDLDLALDFDSGQTHSNLQRPGHSGIPKINQSKSSMAVFLIGGGGATMTKSSEPDGMTRF